MRTFLYALLAALSSAIQLHAQAAPPTRSINIALTNAELATVLQLYSECTGRTLLQHPLLSRHMKFNLSKDASSSEETRKLIEAALREKGIATIPDGDKFTIVVPEANASSVKPGAPQSDKEAKPQPSASQPDDHLIQPGMIALNGANENQLLQLYADLMGKELDRAEKLPSTALPHVILKTVTPLSKKEAIYAVETLLTWRGIKVIPAGDGFVKAVRVPDSK